MSEFKHSRGTQMLPQVVVATAAVVLLPVALVWWLRAARIITSGWVCVVLAVLLSIAVSAAGSALWKRCDGSERVVFSELLLWGWIRRVRQERKLANVVRMLGIDDRDDLADASSPQQGELLAALATAVDAQDPYTEGHSRRVARHAAMVARQMRLSDEEVRRIRAAAAVHDVGKLRVPAAVLTKPGRLTDDEFELIKHHATEGAALVAGLGDEELTAIVRHHHERFDGYGYPSGLAGADIPLGARIVAVADTFDAITSIRPYRPADSHKRALDHLAAVAGTQLDPAVVRAFVRYYSGRKVSTLWAGLAVVPQRMFGWMHGNSGSAGNVALSEVAATMGGLLAVGLAAMGTAAAVGVSRAAFHGRPGAAVAQGASAGATGAAGAAARSAGGSAARSGAGAVRTAVGGAAARRATVGPTYIAARTSQPRFGGLLSGNGTSTGTAPAGGSRGGSAHSGHPGGPGSSPHPVVKVGGSGPGLAVPGAGPRPKHAGGSGPAPAGHPQPVAVTPVAVTPVAVTPVAASPGPVVTPSGPVVPPPPVAGGSTGTTPSSPGPVATGTQPPTPNPPPSGPTNKDQCKSGGYAQWGFKNQGQCIASIMGH